MTVEELRPLSALRLLTIRREVQAEGTEEWALAVTCNAQVLAECCYTGGERVFRDGEAVLAAMTVREMERLLARLADADAPRDGGNPNFDADRFRRLKEG